VTKPRLLIADDHKIFAEGLKRLLKEDFDIVGVVADGRDLVAAAEKLRPDVMVVDISMPMLNGIEAVRRSKKCIR
jgi:DNA-binding NarL/FixJ family response regulator